MKKRLLVAMLAAAGCTAPEPGVDQTPVDSMATSPAPVPAHPDSAAVARFRALLPEGVLARANACPFECCTYGDWVADTTTPMFAQPRSGGTPAFTLTRGDSLRADSGVVYVTSIALAVVTDTIRYGAEERFRLLPGDTLVLLDPIGEGYWTAWRRGEILNEVPPFFESWTPEGQRGRLIGTPAREWWVRARVGGRTGWFTPDRYRVRGADACG